jgi:peptidyl-prolyl cis-trans isomerase SurA
MEFLDGVAAVIGDEPVLVSELEAYMLMRFNELKIRPDTADMATLRTQFLNEIVEGKVLVEHARKDSTIAVSAQEVEAALAEHVERLMKANNLDQQQLEAELARQGLTLAKFRTQLRGSMEDQLLRRNVHQRHMADITVTRRDVEAFYTQYRDSLPGLGESYRLLQLTMTVPVPDSVRERAYARIREVKTKLDNGEPFDELAKKYSDGPLASTGGDLGFVAKGTLSELAFEEAVFALDPGEVSDIVETRLGFHIIKAIARKDQKMHVQQIAIDVAAPEGVEQAVRARLDSIRTACAGNVTAFVDALKAHSTDARTRARDGNVGWIAGLNIPSAWRSAFDTLAVGAVSNPLASGNAIMVLCVAEHNADRRVTIEDDYDMLAEKAKDILAQKKLNELVQRWRRELFIDIRIE